MKVEPQPFAVTTKSPFGPLVAQLSRGAAAEASQGQVPIQIGTPPLDQSDATVRRPGGAPEYQRRPPFLRTPSGCEESSHFVTRGGVPTSRDLPLATFFHAFRVVLFCSLVVLAPADSVRAQRQMYPKEIRGYKVERAAVELKSTETKKPSKSDNSSGGGQDDASRTGDDSSSNQTNTAPSNTGSAVDQLITFGSPSIARVTPLGITFNVPVVVAPIKQSGKVDFLLFEDMMVNDHSIEIDEYQRAFNLPTKKPLTLNQPLRFFIYTPIAALAAVGEWSNSKETWPVTGRVYVCGKYKKFLLSFKRCVPVELNLTMRNPLRG
jgi:hypothetical protein